MKLVAQIQLIACLIVAATAQFSLARQNEEQIDFEKQVKPILEAYCFRCHGPELDEAGVRVDEPGIIVEYYIEKGDAPNSEIYDRLIDEEEDYHMPPPGEPQPSDSDVATIRAWINQGAEWPEGLEFTERVPDEGSGENEQSDTGDESSESSDNQASDTTQDPPGNESNSETGDQSSDPNQEGEGEEGEESEESQESEPSEEPTSAPGETTENEFWNKLWENCGALHPVLIHFPIAMLIGGALFALLGLRPDSPLGDAAYYCLWLAALTGILASVVGWSYAEFWHSHNSTWDDFDFSKKIVQHRWGGILVTVLSIMFALIAFSTRRNDPYARCGLWKLGLIFTAILAGYVGHLGGDMTHKGEVIRAINRMEFFEDSSQPAERDTTTDSAPGRSDTSEDAEPPVPDANGESETADDDEASDESPEDQAGETDAGGEVDQDDEAGGEDAQEQEGESGAGDGA